MQRPEYTSTGKLFPSGHLHPGAGLSGRPVSAPLREVRSVLFGASPRACESLDVLYSTTAFHPLTGLFL